MSHIWNVCHSYVDMCVTNIVTCVSLIYWHVCQEKWTLKFVFFYLWFPIVFRIGIVREKMPRRLLSDVVFLVNPVIFVHTTGVLILKQNCNFDWHIFLKPTLSQCYKSARFTTYFQQKIVFTTNTNFQIIKITCFKREMKRTY